MTPMSAQPRQELRQNQGLFMSARMRQSIQILQLSNAELHEFLDAEIEKNPLLEHGSREPGPAAPQSSLPREAGPAGDVGRWTSAGDLDDDGTGRLAEAGPALRDAMFEQLVLSGCTTAEREIGAHLIAALDPAGRLGGSIGDIAALVRATPQAVEAVRQRMMRFDPPGLFATSLQECLTAQLQERDRFDPAMARLLDNLDLLARHDLKRLRQACDVSAEDLEDMIAELRGLDPKPGADPDRGALTVIVPDILMEQTAEGGWTLELNPDSTPRVVLNSALNTRMSLRAHGAERTYLNDSVTSANWLIRAVQQRSMTILRVSTEILRRQEDFLHHGPLALQPLTLRTIAEALDIHESTVSRVTANKYIATPRGVLPLKFFFVAAMTGNDGEVRSNVAIQSVIRTMIQNEHADAILSDDAISLALRRQGVAVARRTVAKYREAMGFPNSIQRQQRARQTMPS
jgi:RNA polymerase sigma-54 factor